MALIQDTVWSSVDSYLPAEGAPVVQAPPLQVARPEASSSVGYKERMLQLIDDVNDRLFRIEEGLLDSGYKQLNSALGGGIYPGLYLLPGQTNIGKTTFMLNLALSIADRNKNVTSLYFTLDENEIGVVPKIVASLSHMPIDAVRYPKRFMAQKGMLQRRNNGLEMLKDLAKEGRFSLYGTSDGDGTVEWIAETVRSIMIEDEEAKPCIFIDFLNDIRTREGIEEETPRIEHVVSVLMSLSRTHDIPIFLTAEIRKTNRRPGARPVIEDAKGTNHIIYKMDAVLMLFNEVDVLSAGAKVYWQRDGVEGKQPVLEAAIQKTRFGSKRTLFFNFLPEQARFIEPTDAAIREYWTRLQE